MKKILLVDDEKRIRMIYRLLLTTEGFAVFESSNADEANEIVKHEHMDLVLLDLKMPEVGGDVLYEVLQCFHAHCKIIVSSVYPLEEQRRMIMAADEYFDKSQGLKVLLSKIRKVLGLFAYEEAWT
jgi:DNA-binding response OmpR family regulator